MPAIRPGIIPKLIIDTCYQSGGTAIFISPTNNSNPRKFLVTKGGETTSVWVYIWTLTHGGRVTLPNEFRIQMTSVTSPLTLNPNGVTVLMGYMPDLGVFAGFDIQKHMQFTGGSPSVQIDKIALNNALQNGLSFFTKSNDEVAIGVRPDQFLSYCFNAKSLHKFGETAEVRTLLNKASNCEEIALEDLEPHSSERKQIIAQVSKYARDANFRKVVMNAYENRCAVTRVQLKLVEAAHILPVQSGFGTDHVSNGLALSPTFHKAYDSCLIYLDENYCMRLHQSRVDELSSDGLCDGLDEITRFLDAPIHLPAEPDQRPSLAFIKQANQYRQINT